MQYKGSIKNRLVSIILMVTLFTGFLGYGSFLLWYMNYQYEKVIQESELLGEILGQDVAKLILLNELSAAADISLKLKSFNKLDKMVLYKLDKKAIYEYSKDNKSFKVEALPSKIKDNISIDGKTLKIYESLNYQDNHLGYVSFSFEIETIQEIIIKNLFIAICIILLMFALSYILALYYAKKFTQPILTLVNFLEKIELNKTINLRAKTDENNEFGKLYDEVNTMLYRIENSHRELKIASVAFETQSGMVITNTDGVILRVNKAFSDITGYKSGEVLGLTPAVLKSGLYDKTFYEAMFESLYENSYWSGEIINRKKNGDIVNEQLIIQSVYDNDGKIAYYVGSFIDITEQKVTKEKLKEKENLLKHQTKMAAMGEMIGNIAHQWRQPLSVISTAATGMVLSRNFDTPVSKEQELKQLNTINQTAQYLSQTIDDFRNFFKIDKESVKFNLKNSYKKTLKLINSRFSSLDIEIIENINDVEIFGLENEFMQVVMNLLNNARDVLENKKEQRKLVFVHIKEENNYVIFSITDNGGGIPEAIIDRIFEPYFTTKHKSSGTGIGLYMSLEMVAKHMKGNLSVFNKVYIYDDIEYKGACFEIKIPK